MSRYGFCWDERDHQERARRDARYDHKDRDYYERHSFDSCKEAYTKEFDRERDRIEHECYEERRAEEDRAERRAEEDRAERRAVEARNQRRREEEWAEAQRAEQEQEKNNQSRASPRRRKNSRENNVS